MRLLAVLFSVLLSAGVRAEEHAPPAPASGAAQPQDFKGELSVKGLDAKPGVAGIIKISKADNTVEWVDLLASGEMAQKVEEIAAQHAEVTITGTRGANGITVTKVGDDVKLPPAKKKKKK